MCRLSIVIPFCADDELCEDTLVSVLENRPAGCEVIVVHSQDYADPYDLGSEVRFVSVARNASLVRMVNAGCRAAKGEILHVVQPGVLVCDHWTESVLKSFDEPQVCAVAPLVVDARDAGVVVAAGLRYTRGGRRTFLGAGRRVSQCQHLFRDSTLGPALFAGFYRRWAWEAMGGFCEQLDGDWTDTDFALSLRSLGYRSILDPECVVRSSATTLSDPGSFRSGRCAERVFWRHAANQGWLTSLLLHPWMILGTVLRDWKRPGAYLQLLGRLVALFGLPQQLMHAGRNRQAVELFLLERPSAVISRRSTPFEPAASADPGRSGYREAA